MHTPLKALDGWMDRCKWELGVGGKQCLRHELSWACVRPVVSSVGSHGRKSVWECGLNSGSRVRPGASPQD